MTRRSDSPHIRSYGGNLRDYNGTGGWSAQGVQERYRQYCDLLQVAQPRVPAPVEYREGEVVWIYPIMDDVIRGIETGDPACIAIGVDFLHEDDFFVFGAILKSKTARALRRAQLPESQKARLRLRIVSMLTAGIIPREFREYAKLLRTIGIGEYWPKLEKEVPRSNPFAMHFYNVLRAAGGLPVEK